MELVNTLEIIKDREATYNEASSYYLLRDLQFYKDWHVYSSKDYSISLIKDMANFFCYSHGMTSLSQDFSSLEDSYFWTSIPLGILRYKMLSDGSFGEINIFDKRPGYIVESAYWLNGFVYQVRNKDFLLEVNLFIDDHTKSRYNYIDPNKISK